MQINKWSNYHYVDLLRAGRLQVQVFISESELHYSVLGGPLA